MDYTKELARVDRLISEKRYQDAVRVFAFVLENTLKQVYGQIRLQACTGEAKRLLDIEEKISRGEKNFQRFSLRQLVDLFCEADIPGMPERDVRRKNNNPQAMRLRRFLEFIDRYAGTNIVPPLEEIQSVCSTLTLFLEDTGLIDIKSASSASAPPSVASCPDGEETVRCPGCGEAVRKNWEFCPACETPLVQFTCPLCNRAVKENWKRCPECKARLVCTSCGCRILKGASRCPACHAPVSETTMPNAVFIEPVTGMEFLYVPPGTFMMGDTFGDGSDNEMPVHEVVLDGFYLGKYPVTQGQWNRVMGKNPSKFKKGDDYPVEQATFDEVRTFISKLSKLNRGKYEFRLPTEAQWEYAARSGGKKEKYAGGDKLDELAWYEENSKGSTHPVGEKTANGLGIYDMSGNVWEWCLDIFDEEAYESLPKKNPVFTGGDPKSSERVIRGGSWSLDSWSVRCTRRFGYSPEYYGSGLGFRLVMGFIR